MDSQRCAEKVKHALATNGKWYSLRSHPLSSSFHVIPEVVPELENMVFVQQMGISISGPVSSSQTVFLPHIVTSANTNFSHNQTF